MKDVAKSLIGAAALLAAIAVVAGCGSSGSSSSVGSTGSDSTRQAEESSAAGGSAAAKKLVAEHSDLENLDWPKPPDKPYDPGKGKLGILTCSKEFPGCLEMSEEAVRAAKAAGWETTEVGDGKQTPSVESGILQRFAQEKVDAVVSISVALGSVKSGIDALKEQGIPVASVFSSPEPGFPGTGGSIPLVTQNGIAQGEAAAAFIGADVEGEGKVNVVGDDPLYPILIERVTGLEQGLEKYCPDCKLEISKMSGTELTKPGPPAFSALLSTNPPGSLEWVLGGPTDGYLEPMLKTAEQQGRTDIKMLGFDANVPVLENLAEGGLVKANVFAAFRYASWAGVEQAIRMANGLKPWKSDNLPVGFITPENVEAALSEAPKPYAPPSFDYEAMFKNLWRANGSGSK